MMYSNGFALAVKKGGQVLRETQNPGGHKTVHLPFESEYSVLVKNNNGQRALLKLDIDGMDVGDGEFVINAHSSIDIERFITNGNLHSGKKLKFVPVGDSRVQDPSNTENGVIRAELWLEEPNIVKPPEIHHHHYPNPRRPWGPQYPFYISGETYSSSDGPTMIGCSSVSSHNSNMDSVLRSADMGDKGATVEGGHSDQGFINTTFGIRSAHSTVLELYLRGSKAALTVRNTRKKTCTSCGRQSRRKDKFCPGCGATLPQPVEA